MFDYHVMFGRGHIYLNSYIDHYNCQSYFIIDNININLVIWVYKIKKLQHNFVKTHIQKVEKLVMPI